VTVCTGFYSRCFVAASLLFLLPLIVACAPGRAVVMEKYVAKDRTWSVAADGRTVTYRGVLTAEGVERVVAWLNRYSEIRSLAIESQGGDVDAGMRLGDEVLKRNLDVEVIGSLCASSCANYVFVSGRRKSIAPGAKVIWHGSPLRPEDIPVMDEVIGTDGSIEHELLEGDRLAAYLRRSDIAPVVEHERKRHQAFFKVRGVDGRVTTYGQEVGCGCNWTFSVEDMHRLGIEDVVAEEGYPVSSPTSDELLVVALKLSDTFNRSKIVGN